MQITLTGFPRIGKNREWKKTLENYWKKEIHESQLLETSKHLQNVHLQLMSPLDIAPIDFALYDHVLETAFSIGIIPTPLKESHLSRLEQYFALARGFQGNQESLKAWPMKKWFFTNYHYVVPQISQETSWAIDTFFLQPKIDLHHQHPKPTKIVLVGPYTLLRLSSIKDLSLHSVAEKILKNYEALLRTLLESNIHHIQLDEPALVMDMSREEKHLFLSLYQSLAKHFGHSLIIQTYFGDIRDIYEDIITLPVQAIGLDFVDGAQSLQLIENHGFPRDKTLIAGIVSGKNIWKTDYKQALQRIERITQKISHDRIQLSSSCSLLHVPYTTAGETLPPEIHNALAFAVEKQDELQEIQRLVSISHAEQDTRFQNNQQCLALFQKNTQNTTVQERLSGLSDRDFQRNMPVEQRLSLQAHHLNLPLLPTTTIGSFPQTSELRRLRRDYQEKRLSNEQYEHAIRTMIAACIKEQEDLGLDVLVHGEFERNDMVEFFASFLDGFTTTKNGWVQSYGSRAVKPPLIYGDVSRHTPMTIQWTAYAQSQTKKPLKAILTGPITIINWSFCRENVPLREVAYQIALALREEINELQAIGTKIIQVDEAALREKLPLRKTEWQAYLDIATSGFRLATSLIRPEIQLHTHMCYSEFNDIPEAIEQLDADVLTIEASRSNLDTLESLQAYSQKRDIGPGVYDIHSPRIPSQEEIENTIQKLTTVIPTTHLWINPDCGLKTRQPEEAYQSLKNMVAATKKFRQNNT